MPADPVTTDLTTVAVPRWALAWLLERGDFADAGPHGSGWSSALTEKALAAVATAFPSTEQDAALNDARKAAEADGLDRFTGEPDHGR